MEGLPGRVLHTRWYGLPAVDVVLATLLCALSTPGAALGMPDDGPRAVTVPVAVVMSLALAWRNRRPLVTVAVVVAAGQLQTLVAHEPGSIWAFAVYLVATYTVASAATEGRAAVGGALVVGALWLQEAQEGGTDYLFVAVVFGGAWLLGRLTQQWRARATRAEEEQDVRARLAVAEERARIARELHDIVAHGISVIAVQADAAEAVLSVQPERAREPLTVIRSSAREVLDEMRRLLVLLRMSGDEQEDGPQPGLGDLPELVSSARAAGLPVELRVDDAAAGLAPGVELSAYRIVQEALTNVLKHAGPVPTSVLVRREDDGVLLEVTNPAPVDGHRPAPSAGNGHGLVGVRERVALHGGALQVGAQPDGGFLVRAQLPNGPVGR